MALIQFLVQLAGIGITIYAAVMGGQELRKWLTGRPPKTAPTKTKKRGKGGKDEAAPTLRSLMLGDLWKVPLTIMGGVLFVALIVWWLFKSPWTLLGAVIMYIVVKWGMILTGFWSDVLESPKKDNK